LIDPVVTSDAPEMSASPVSALWNVLLEPKATFQGLRERNPWILPFVVLCVLIFGFSYVNWTEHIDQRIQSVKLNEDTDSSTRDLMLQQLEPIRDTPVLWQVALGPVFAPIFWLVGCGLWLMIGNVVMGGNGSFKGIWSVFLYANMASAVEMIVQTALIQMKGSADVFTSLALMVPGADQNSFMFRALNGVDVFAIWFFALMGIGLSVACKVNTKKAVITSFVMWAIWSIGIKAGLGSAFGGMMGM
jgi:hypothetical protein